MTAFMAGVCIVLILFAYIAAQYGDTYKRHFTAERALNEDLRSIADKEREGRRRAESRSADMHKELDTVRAARDRAIKSATKWHKACEAINEILKQTEEPTQ